MKFRIKKNRIKSGYNSLREIIKHTLGADVVGFPEGGHLQPGSADLSNTIISAAWRLWAFRLWSRERTDLGALGVVVPKSIPNKQILWKVLIFWRLNITHSVYVSHTFPHIILIFFNTCNIIIFIINVISMFNFIFSVDRLRSSFVIRCWCIAFITMMFYVCCVTTYLTIARWGFFWWTFTLYIFLNWRCCFIILCLFIIFWMFNFVIIRNITEYNACFFLNVPYNCFNIFFLLSSCKVRAVV